MFIIKRFPKTILALAIIGLFLCGMLSIATAEVKGAEHAVIIGCDGLRADSVEKADTPTMHRLMKSGSYTLKMRAVMPTSSSPNWASMIMGAGPEQHGITSNDWQPNKFEIEPTVTGPGGIFPTIFSVLRQQRPKSNLAVFHDWDDFGRLFERPMVDTIVDCTGAKDTVHKAIAYLKEKKPDFLFLHLDNNDHAGHGEGYGSPNYLEAVKETDSLINELIEAVRQAGIADSTILMVVSDHGGIKKGHGGSTMTEIEIPFIISGPGIQADKVITSPVNIYDIAPTIAYIFSVKAPACWIAKPIIEAFK